MISTKLRTRAAATLISVSAAAAMTVAGGVGQANASQEFPIPNCIGVSPNIVDIPFKLSNAIVSQYQDTTWITVTYGSLWVGVGYDSAVRLDWRNPATGQSGTKLSESRVVPPNTGVHSFQFPTEQIGKGRVEVSFSSVNRNALWAIPALTCSGSVVVP